MFEKYADVVVAGGGVAGVAAAIAAARRGAKVILLEKSAWMGGLATSGVINVYLPLCDGNGHQVTFGISEEMMRRSMDYGPGTIPEKWREVRNAERRERLHCSFSPASMVLTLDEMCEEAGVEVWLDTLVIGADGADGRLHSVTAANKSGIGKISAQIFIDASGDSDLAHLSGAGTQCAGNRMASWAVEYFTGEDINALSDNVRILMFGGEKTYAPGIDGRKVSNMLLDGRRAYRNELKKLYADNSATRQSRYPLLLPAMASFRTTRCFASPFTLRDGMQWRRFDDSIGVAADWRKAGFLWEIPFRTLLSEKYSNLLAAGRCTASSGDAWEVTRVIPVAAMTGEAAGVAAALALDKNVAPGVLAASEVGEKLVKESGFVLHFADLGLSC